MIRRALCLFGAVMVGLGAAAAAGPAGPGHTFSLQAQGPGRPNPAHLPVHASAEDGLGTGKLGTAHLPVSPWAKEALGQRLAARGLRIGRPVMIRIFKAEAELELWMQGAERFELLDTYPICNWAGALGPKLREGDKQSPEGLYSIGRRQLHHSRRWQHSLDIGYPNAFDRLHARTGSSILVHGGCTSTGCFAMTDQVMEEIFHLSRAALRNGQKRIAVHIFPFRMTPENMAAHGDSHWQGFWANLKEAYDLFERTRVPPAVRVCARRYVVGEVGGGGGCPGGVAGALDGVAAAVNRALATPKRRGAAAANLRRPGRHARKAGADARKVRLAGRAAQATPAKPRGARTVVYRRLPR